MMKFKLMQWFRRKPNTLRRISNLSFELSIVYDSLSPEQQKEFSQSFKTMSGILDKLYLKLLKETK